MTETAETHVELNQFPVPRVGPRHSTIDSIDISSRLNLFIYNDIVHKVHRTNKQKE